MCTMCRSPVKALITALDDGKVPVSCVFLEDWHHAISKPAQPLACAVSRLMVRITAPDLEVPRHLRHVYAPRLIWWIVFKAMNWLIAPNRERATEPVFLNGIGRRFRRPWAQNARGCPNHEEQSAVSHPLSPTGIENVEGARRIMNSRAYQHGMIEPQDAASQAVWDMVPLEPAEKLLDVCAVIWVTIFFRSRRLSFYAFSSLFAAVK